VRIISDYYVRSNSYFVYDLVIMLGLLVIMLE